MALLLAERGTVTEAIVKPGWRVYPPARDARDSRMTRHERARGLERSSKFLLGGESADR